MRLFDMHTHLQADDLHFAPNFHQLAVASTPEDCERLMHLARKHTGLHVACGLHPWHSDVQTLDALLPYLEQSFVIGEIGMDRVWCQVDIAVQGHIFRAQLEIAEAQKKPIVLHTKGCEREVLDEIQGFTQPILVHWYSGDEYLQAYIEKDCYFSVGPDLQSNRAVQAVAQCVPLARLVLESDGAGALAWALGRPFCAGDVPVFLEEQVTRLAQIRGLAVAQMEQILFENSLRFLDKL